MRAAHRHQIGAARHQDRIGVIGFEKNSVIRKIVQNEKSPFEIDRKAPMMINALVMDFDEASLRCVKVEALNQAVEDPR